LNPVAEAGIYQGKTALSAAVGDGHRLYLSPEAERVLKFERTHRFDSFQPTLDPALIRQSGIPNTAMLDDLPSANNFDPLLPARYVAWVAELEAAAGTDQIQRLRLTDVGWLAGEVGEEPPWVSYTPMQGARRVRLVPSAVTASDSAEALRMVSSSDFEPEEIVILETISPIPESAGGIGAATIRPSPHPNRVEVDVDAPQGGWLLLSDTWFPGWNVSVDGTAAESYPADGIFRAVWVPPGASTVVWEYRPASFRIGVVTSGAGLFALIALLGLWVTQRRRA
jgi:MYXO-CTERM domain-containing protein